MRTFKFLSSVSIVFLLASKLSAGVINVPADRPTIQAGIDEALNGDEVVVAPGEYFENINLMGKAITLRSTNPTDPGTILNTIINGGAVGTVVTCDSGEGPDTVISGFLITNGLASSFGGGMLNDGASPTISHCSFTGNAGIQGSRGGGMANLGGANPIVRDCVFSANTADFGGGMYNESSSPTVTRCVFNENDATAVNILSGGGLFSIDSSSLTVTHSSFVGNSAQGGGGGMCVFNSRTTVADCTFAGNSSGVAGIGLGGGIFSVAAFDTTVTRSLFTENTSDGFGGGMQLTSGTVTHCSFVGNTASSGGGLRAVSATVSDCSFVCNTATDSGGGLYSSRTPTITRCLFSQNSAPEGGGLAIVEINGSPQPSVTMTDSVVCRNAPGQIGGLQFIVGGGNAISDDHCLPVPPSPSEPPPFLGDFDVDGDVDMFDFAIFQSAFTGPL
jgi:Right handed beta helix region